MKVAVRGRSISWMFGQARVLADRDQADFRATALSACTALPLGMRTRIQARLAQQLRRVDRLHRQTRDLVAERPGARPARAGRGLADHGEGMLRGVLLVAELSPNCPSPGFGALSPHAGEG